MHCMANGHDLVALANLHPKDTTIDELDSFMFQTVGHDVIDRYQECFDDIPLYRHAIKGNSANIQLEYSPTKQDEIEDLHELLQKVKSDHPDLEAVSCGAILSHYQRTRVENVCDRLDLTSLAYLWQRNQEELMREMCSLGLEARLIKVAAVGLDERHLGLLLQEALPTLTKLKALYDVHVCGEGGEFESLVLDAPIFSKRLQFKNKETKSESSDTLYLRVEVEVTPKERITSNEPTLPPLLEGEFQEILNENEFDPRENSALSINLLPIATDPYQIRLSQTEYKYFISNVSSKLYSVEEQAKDCLTQIVNILRENNMEAFDIQHMTVLVSDMNDFAAINSVYSEFFKQKYLPPSRVCVETILPSQIRVQISCISLKRVSERLGVHIRSRSYWAPQNIGPYSQAITQTTSNFKSASLSGQIPLVPASMDLIPRSMAFNTILALQHLHRVMQMINIMKISSLTCFITNPEMKDIVAQSWSGYLERLGADADTHNKLLIVQVASLPRGAFVEWGGFVFEPIASYDDDDDDDDNNNGGDGNLDTDSLPILKLLQLSTSVYGSISILVYSGNEISCLGEFLRRQNVVDSSISVMATHERIQQLTSEGCNAEWLPVVNVWDADANNQQFGCIWERKV